MNDLTLINSDYYVDETKVNRIDIGLNKWRSNNGKGTLLYPARFGKTLAGILLLRKMFKSNPSIRVIVGTKNSISKMQWDKQLSFEFGNKVEVYTYNQILNMSGRNKNDYTLFICDEVHNLFSEMMLGIITKKYFTYKYILGLTATIPNNEDFDKLCPAIDEISIEEAIAYNWIVNYREINVALELSIEDKERYYEFSRIMRETLGSKESLFYGITYKVHNPFGNGRKYLFNDDYDALISCYSGKRLRDYSGRPLYLRSDECRSFIAKAMGWDVNLDLSIEFNQERDFYWNPSAIEDRVRKYVDIQNKRNDLICNNPIKLNAVLKLYEKFNLPCICFNDSISFAESISKNIDRSFCYHSKLKGVQLIDYSTGQYITNKKDGNIKKFGLKSIRDYLISNFKAGNIKFISTVEALDESLDVQNISLVITTTGSVNPIQYRQRISRANTIDVNNPDKEAIILNLFFDDFIINDELIKSRDKTKLIVRQKDSYNVEWLLLSEILC